MTAVLNSCQAAHSTGTAAQSVLAGDLLWCKHTSRRAAGKFKWCVLFRLSKNWGVEIQKSDCELGVCYNILSFKNEVIMNNIITFIYFLRDCKEKVGWYVLLFILFITLSSKP